MRAVIINSNGSPEVLEYVENYPEPKVGENQVLVKIQATTLNNVDLVLRRGYPGLKLSFPHILGGDIAGVIVDKGVLVNDFQIGDKVVAYPVIIPPQRNPKFNGLEHLNNNWSFLGMQVDGSYAEYIAIPSENLVKINGNTPIEYFATIPVAGLTAYTAVVELAKIQPGEVFFMWGGSSAVGNYALRIAKKMGATVITTTGYDWKKETIHSFGADYVFNHQNENVVEQVLKLFPEGVDAVLDFVGTSTFTNSINLLRKNGKLMVCGMLTGREVNLNIQLFYLKHLQLLGYYLGSLNSFRNLVKMVSNGIVIPHIDKIFELKEASEAHKYMESQRHIGKIVLKI